MAKPFAWGGRSQVLWHDCHNAQGRPRQHRRTGQRQHHLSQSPGVLRPVGQTGDASATSPGLKLHADCFCCLKRSCFKGLLLSQALCRATALQRQAQLAAQVLGGAKEFAIIARRWDETQMALQWNKTHQHRFLIWATARAHRRIAAGADPHEELQAVKQMSKAKHGTLAICVQSARLRWGLQPQEAITCFVGPQALERCNAETILASLDKALPQFSAAQLSLGSLPRFVVVAATADAASANGRLFQLLRARLPDKVGILKVHCGLHQANLALRPILLDAAVLSPLFSLANVLRLSDVQTRLTAAVASQIVSRFRYTRVASEASSRTSVTNDATFRGVVLQHTLLRPFLGAASGTPSFPQPANWSPVARRQLELAEQLMVFFNSDNWLSSDNILHHCHGCCSSHAEALRKASSLLSQALLGNLPSTPALSRWTATQASVAFWALGALLHKVLPQAWAQEWPAPALDIALPEAHDLPDALVGDQEADSAQDWRKQIAQRTLRGTRWLTSRATAASLMVLAIITFPMDRFTAWLSAADQNRVAPLVLSMASHSGPAATTVRALCELLNDNSPLNIALRSLPNPADIQRWRLKAMVYVLTLASAMQIRFDLMYKSLPLGVLQLAQPGLSEEARAQLAQRIWDTSDCCVDQFFLGPLKRAGIVSSAESLLQDSFLQALHGAALELSTNIADCERQHAENRGRAMTSAKAARVSLEHIHFEHVLRSFANKLQDNVRSTLNLRSQPRRRSLGDVGRAHLRQGGLVTMRDLGRDRARSKRAQVGGSPWMVYRSAQMRGWVATPGPGQSRKLCRQRKERAVRESWLSMPPDQKAVWGRDVQAQSPGS